MLDLQCWLTDCCHRVFRLNQQERIGPALRSDQLNRGRDRPGRAFAAKARSKSTHSPPSGTPFFGRANSAYPARELQASVRFSF